MTQSALRQCISRMSFRWELTAGLRYDDYNDFGDTWNPRLALVWAARHDLTAKVLYGQAFRAPSFTEFRLQNNPVALGNDELDPEDPAMKIAVGFLRLGPWHPIGVPQEARQALLNEMTATVGSVFLGLTLRCAQCHDHKYDPIPQADFYRLQAFFAPIEIVEVEAGFRDAARQREMQAQAEEHRLRLVVGVVRRGDERPRS